MPAGVKIRVAVLDGETVDDGTMDKVYVNVGLAIHVSVGVGVNVYVINCVPVVVNVAVLVKVCV